MESLFAAENVVQSSSTQETWKAWDNGKMIISPLEWKLCMLKEGEPIGDLLDGYTGCPVGNATCVEYTYIKIAKVVTGDIGYVIHMVIEIYAYNPRKGGKTYPIHFASASNAPEPVIQDGKKIGRILSEFIRSNVKVTIEPADFKKIMLCSLGVKDIDGCILSK